MVATLVEFVAREFRVAGQALEFDDASEELPEEVTPGDLLRSEAKHKFVEFKGLVSNVRSEYLTMSIDQNLATLTELPASLTLCEEVRAVGTSLKHVLRVLEQDLQLFHENFALQFIFFVNKVLQEFDLDLGRQAFDEARIHAVHING